MQLNSIYLYPNLIDVYTNLGTWTEERYRKVYQRNLKIYRGVNNRLDFQLRNGQQRQQSISNLTIVFNLLTREGKDLIKSWDCTVHDAINGRVYATINEADAMELVNGDYQYSLYTVNSSGVKTPLYMDSQYGAIGYVEVLGSVYPEPNPTAQATLTNISGSQVTSEFNARPEFNSNSALHTFAFYCTNFTGQLDIEGTLESTAPFSWVTVDSINLVNKNLVYKNISGVWSKLRVKQQTNTQGSLDKVLYRY